jgi:hypothetical protein
VVERPKVGELSRKIEPLVMLLVAGYWELPERAPAGAVRPGDECSPPLTPTLRLRRHFASICAEAEREPV